MKLNSVMQEYIKIFAVRPFVRYRCRCGHNEFAGRVQNPQVHFSFHMHSTGHNLEIVKAAAGQDTLRCRLHEGCHCGSLSSH